ncbi:unnamed protein product [Cyprideis torosa]|uniref:Uncharacterized protein n=1 Tax=Cyprideis torosa TaxID=163714 RepID=A0A7R8WKR4_9CRUS|nr:unnamed protein product [Cyprideis torosa]CAG0903513.1 unnamed protein product [Cyprideis torosa]
MLVSSQPYRSLRSSRSPQSPSTLSSRSSSFKKGLLSLILFLLSILFICLLFTLTPPNNPSFASGITSSTLSPYESPCPRDQRAFQVLVDTMPRSPTLKTFPFLCSGNADFDQAVLTIVTVTSPSPSQIPSLHRLSHALILLSARSSSTSNTCHRISGFSDISSTSPYVHWLILEAHLDETVPPTCSPSVEYVLRKSGDLITLMLERGRDYSLTLAGLSFAMNPLKGGEEGRESATKNGQRKLHGAKFFLHYRPSVTPNRKHFCHGEES